jgi:hypothetical protein
LARGHIADVAEAVDSPRRLTDDEDCARRVLDLIAQGPTPVWGRDQLATGEMWNSNSVIAWVIARSGTDAEPIQPPAGGRAPGWQAGLVASRRQNEEAARTAAMAQDHDRQPLGGCLSIAGTDRPLGLAPGLLDARDLARPFRSGRGLENALRNGGERRR